MSKLKRDNEIPDEMIGIAELDSKSPLHYPADLQIIVHLDSDSYFDVLTAHERLVPNPVRLIRISALPLLQILDIRLVVPLEPDDLGIPFERQNVRRNTVEKPPIVRDHNRAS